MVIFHVPLFTSWLKDVRAAGTRALMIIDGPDDLEQLMAPPGLKEAVLYADQLLAKTKQVRVTSEGGTDLTYSCGEYPVMSQYGYADEPGRFDHWGAGHVHTFPNEGSANGVVVFQPGDIVILPYCRYVQDEVRLEIEDGFVTKMEGQLDAKLMNDWLSDNMQDADDHDPFAISHLGWGMNPQALWYGIALNGDEPERSRAAARTFPGNFLFSTGPNNQGGGKRTTRGHYDAPMRDCSIELDGETGDRERKNCRREHGCSARYHLVQNNKERIVKIENRFVVAAPIDKVWVAITDPKIVAPCIPGCEDVEVLSPTAYKAKVKIAVGPIKAGFNLDIEVTKESPPDELISAVKGEEGSRASTIKAENILRLKSTDDGGTEVDFSSDVSVVGRLGKVRTRYHEKEGAGVGR